MSVTGRSRANSVFDYDRLAPRLAAAIEDL
jgi:hypothetical protein